jgi:hypothetical protein
LVALARRKAKIKKRTAAQLTFAAAQPSVTRACPEDATPGIAENSQQFSIAAKKPARGWDTASCSGGLEGLELMNVKLPSLRVLTADVDRQRHYELIIRKIRWLSPPSKMVPLRKCVWFEKMRRYKAIGGQPSDSPGKQKKCVHSGCTGAYK